MRAEDIWPGLRMKACSLTCRVLGAEGEEAPALYRVPVEHRPLRGLFPADAAALDAIPDGPSLGDLKAILRETNGLGLFAPRAHPLPTGAGDGAWMPKSTLEQAAVGSILVWPPSEWARLRSEFADWCSDGVEAAFAGLPYGFADVVPFASINFSPDCWLLVVRGEMAGRIFWWTHDGDPQMETPWAASIAAWGERVRREVPEVFGGSVRFDQSASAEPVRGPGVLYPERLEDA